MQKTVNQIIDISNILNDDHESKQNYQIKIESNIFKDHQILNSVIGNIEINKIANNEVLCYLNLKVKIKLICDRCTKEYNQLINIYFDQIFNTNPDLDNDEKPIINNKINIYNCINDQIILNIPMKLLCNDNCKGIKGIKISKES